MATRRQPGRQCGCGARIEPGDRFCVSCGRQVQIHGKACSCGQPLEPHDRFCQECGNQVKQLVKPTKKVTDENGKEIEVPMEGECVVCLSNPRETRLPCGHAAHCKECLLETLHSPEPSCPYCRLPLSHIEQGKHIAEQPVYVRPPQKAVAAE